MGALRFDLCRFQVVPWRTLVDDVRYLEQTNAGTVWVSDLYVNPPRADAPVLESWTTLAALASETERVRLGALVTNVALRHPAMLAKQVATVDRISGGRVDLALGAGYYASELESLGLPVLTPRGRADRLREAVDVIDGLLRERRLTYAGDHYLKGSKMLDHAAARWYSWMSPPSRSRRSISPRLGGASAVVESGVSSASPRWGRSQL